MNLRPCYFKDLGYRGCEYRADGQPDPAHFIPQTRLKAAFRSRGMHGEDIRGAIWDPRAWEWACRRHHTLFDGKIIRLQAEQYPPELHAYAAEFDFEFIDPRTGWVAVQGKEAA